MVSVVRRIFRLCGGRGRVTGGKGIALVMKKKVNVKQLYLFHKKKYGVVK